MDSILDGEMAVKKWQEIYFILGAYGTRGNEVNICSTMPQNKLDYQKNQESGPKPGNEQLYRNLEIALPSFFGFASNFVYTIIQRQLDDARGERSSHWTPEDC